MIKNWDCCTEGHAWRERYKEHEYMCIKLYHLFSLIAMATGRRNRAEQHEFSHNLLADIVVTTMFEQIGEVSEY